MFSSLSDVLVAAVLSAEAAARVQRWRGRPLWTPTKGPLKTRWPLRDISWCVRVLGADDDASSGFAVNFVRATHPTLEGTAVTRDKSSTHWNPPESWPLAAYVGEGDESRNIRPVRQALPPRARL